MLTGNGLNPGPFSAAAAASPPGWASSLSVDQRIANAVGDDTAFKSVELGVQVGAADNWGACATPASNRPLPPEDNPYARLRARVRRRFTTDPAELARIRAHRLSVLDRVAGRYNRLSARLGAADRQKLDAHLGSIRDIESRLRRRSPHRVPRARCLPSTPGSISRPTTRFPQIGKLQMDLLVMSLACDLTRVASLQWSRSASPVRFTWLHLNELHHDLSHRGDDDADAVDKLTRINRWYAEQLAYLIGRMKQIPEGDGTLLDNTRHSLVQRAGQGQRARPHRRALRAGRPRRRRAVAPVASSGSTATSPTTISCSRLIHAMGQDDSSFGNPDWCTGPLAGLL